MERIFHKARSFDEARAWDDLQRSRTSPEERQRIAKLLRERVYGKEPPDVREAERSR